MKALTLHQPFATLIALGAKRIETRSFRTHYRGPLAIHAAKRFPVTCRDLCGQKPYWTVLSPHFKGSVFAIVQRIPRGAVVATCRLVGCVPVTEVYAGRAYLTEEAPYTFTVSDLDMAFGNYGPGRWAWLLEDIVMDHNPIAVNGAQGLWNWDGGPKR